MYIKKIMVENFRNYSFLNLQLNPKINIFIGKNGAGKTNVLESISILSITKSHRSFINENLIKINCVESYISAEIKNEEYEYKLEVILNKSKKTVKKNKNEIKRIIDYISNLNTITFTPDDLDIVKNSPNIRRKLLNIEISQLSKKYINNLNKYNKVLKIRNEYLRLNKKNDEYFEIITEYLISEAINIYLDRKRFIDNINRNIKKIYYDIAEIDNLRIKYINNFDKKEIDKEYIKKTLEEKFVKIKEKELFQQKTLFGPHRDDFEFDLDGKNLKFFGSQGQQRLAIIAFKLAEIDIFKELTKTTPVILLDDILSEIDEKKKNKLLDYINNDCQIIITATDLKNINKKTIKNSTVFEVDDGIIKIRER